MISAHGALFLYGVFVNLLAFLLFWRDKRNAVTGRRRIPEARLLGAAVLGGWPGAKLAQRLLRHKTRKHPFSRRLSLIGLLWLLCSALGASAWLV
ncbi:DUF1294 domain-containing protein [Cognatishimia sp. F0-27]|uniref:DUF1294 domain-containing protein n=1 Tax=Cognatishimia sp. F0-27 TaxID=2816855 RepID=UPI001D0CB84F|nr:DUF1294 domain-containing protein [Cognatishimia sp. F0-27]MCC1492088.1 DUF1294 domain-containing protein [Cognatishimia sp. F0-27]